MLKKLAFTIFSISFAVLGLYGQKVWTLEDCVNHARENNLQIQQARLTERQGQINYLQAKNNRLPNLSANSGLQYSGGRNIDPLTNAFIFEAVGFNSYGVNTGATLFNGGALTNTIKQRDLQLKEAELRTKQTSNDVALLVVNAYISAVFEEERLENAIAQLDISETQLERVNKMIEAGSMADAERFDLESQVARDRQQVVFAENNVATSRLNLILLLRLPPEENIQLDRPNIEPPTDAQVDNYQFGEVYAKAQTTQPGVRADQLRVQSAELDVALAKAQFYPSISIGGSISSTFATIGKQADGFQTVRVPQEGVFINGEPILFEVESRVPTGISNTPFIDQLDQNLGLGFGLQVNIPIYSRGQNRTNVELAKLNQQSVAILNEQNQETLKNNVQLAITEAKAAKRSYEAAQVSLETQQAAFENTTRRFDVGAANSYELTEVKNRMDVAMNDLLIAKYDYIFKLKVLDFYLGKPIKID